MVSPSLVINLLFILIICRVVSIADIAIVHNQVGSTKDRATLTTAIGITLNGRNAFVEAIVLRQGGLILTNSNDHMGLTKNVTSGCGRRLIVITYVAFPAATIDVTNRTTFDIGCR